MSIWSSIRPGVPTLPRRNEYTGEPLDIPDWFVDVAVCTAWNDCIRLIVCDEDEVNYSEVRELMSVAEARALIDALEQACAVIEAAQDKTATAPPTGAGGALSLGGSDHSAKPHTNEGDTQ